MLYCTGRKAACFTFLCPSACYLCVLHFHWGNIHTDKCAPCHLEGCVFHVFFPVTEGKCIQGVQGVPFQLKMHLSVLKVQINMLPQWETRDPRAGFVPCFLTVRCDAPSTNHKFTSPMFQKPHSVERQASKDYSLSNCYHVYPGPFPF